ncbi:hypothetical protein UFOVP972_94 [uncultured Caudovirales phage]|uniref:Uncharacterized protein n=1 Tax=uncultured Caudovirales phage TaxID=2100421 RepID=A0A6J5Q0N4_9CAUD|nr:hypothetical protein UFOVP972_94 [uncultured Caudovirales phage]
MEQTAVEWLEHEVSNLVVTTKEYVMILLEQAKEMDKAERAKEYLKGFEDGKEYMKNRIRTD